MWKIFNERQNSKMAALKTFSIKMNWMNFVDVEKYVCMLSLCCSLSNIAIAAIIMIILVPPTSFRYLKAKKYVSHVGGKAMNNLWKDWILCEATLYDCCCRISSRSRSSSSNSCMERGKIEWSLNIVPRVRMFT